MASRELSLTSEVEFRVFVCASRLAWSSAPHRLRPVLHARAAWMLWENEQKQLIFQEDFALIYSDHQKLE